MSTQTSTILKASPNISKGDTGIQQWDDNVTIAAYSADGSNAQISYRRKGGLGIVGSSYNNQLDYDVRQGASEQFEIDFNGDVQQVGLTLGRIERSTASAIGIWKAFCAEGNLVASGQLNVSTAMPVGSHSYRFAIATNKAFERLTIAAAIDQASPGPTNTANFSLENVGYSRVTKAASQANCSPATEEMDPPITLSVKRAALKDQGSRLIWTDGVEVTGYSADGTDALLKKSSGGLSVRGGRYGNQIDFDADLGKGEGLNIGFSGAVRQLSVVLTQMEIDDGAGLPETGLWRAYDAEGRQIAVGKLDPSKAEQLGDSSFRFAITPQKAIAKLTIEATAYGNGAGRQYSDNNSDFRLQSLTYSRVSDKDSTGEDGLTDQPPVAIDDSMAVREDTPIIFAANSLLSNDSTGNTPAAIIEIDSQSAKGGSIVQQSNGKYRYTPAANFFGQDRFSYSIANTNNDTSSAIVNVNVSSVNDLPVAIGKSVQTDAGAGVSIEISPDFGGDGPYQGAILAGSAANGTVSVDTQGTPKDPTDDLIAYIPNPKFSGTDYFHYTATDANGDTSTARIEVKVNPLEPSVPPVEPRTRIDLTASPHYLDGTTSPQNWGSEVQLSASGFDGRAARVSYYERKSDKGFGVISPKDRAKQIDFYQDKGSEKLNLAFDTLVGNVVLTVGMMGVNEDNTGFDETGKWTALDTYGRVVDTGLIGPDKSSLGPGIRVTDTYGQYPIEIDAPSPFAALVIEATGFGHGKGAPTQQKYGENNSDFDITAISFDIIPGTQGGF
ncbi:cadherin-like domain-containing protein [cf. Phormidesmis sp. LEGE 11477]|uniref:cadherin-like domain-containing protein n=1 Tax=cf. Phormidesmis sp. LEGE 11477 TaxID=1828680 RepID=UPI001882312A|nr:cadherin-like domain-containing protein [cf. Phormidesmis sp. LEGE 11477]MBE9062324.1 tandem-95 repeat protein [cf. Phormidesmis sp. LEGE 11477]